MQFSTDSPLFTGREDSACKDSFCKPGSDPAMRVSRGIGREHDGPWRAKLLAAVVCCVFLAGFAQGAQASVFSPAPGSVLPGNSATFTWNAVSGVIQYQLWVGTNGVGSGNIGVYTQGQATGSTVSAIATGIPTSGATVYARLFTWNGSTWGASDYSYKESSSNGGGGTGTLQVSTTSLSFGNVGVNTTATQSLTLKNSGSAGLTIGSASISGTGFTVSGASFPLNLSSGQTATVSVQFDPKSTGTDSGALTFSTSSGNTTVTLSGSGVSQGYSVDLSWNAATGSSDSVAGYDVFRSSNGGGSYQMLNSSVDTSTKYSDTTVKSGASYKYYVESVDSSGHQSAPSGVYSVSVP